jgi:succinoglycan biosynthesis protein ExoO
MTKPKVRTEGRPPTVSVIMANYNGSPYLKDAVSSIQKQTLQDFELIVSDDASRDDSVQIVNRLIADDPRIRLLENERNQGPAAARNRALDVASGTWIAIVDSDDVIHPDRLATIVTAASRDGASLAADDLLIFDSRHAVPPKTLLAGAFARRPFWLDAATYIERNHLYGSGSVLGYLKPIFRRDLIENGLRYDEALKIGEDYHFALRMLLAGAKFRVYPELLYFYRRHGTSISHRLDPAPIEAMKFADAKLAHNLGETNRDVRVAIDNRARSINRALAYEEILNSLRSRRWLSACRGLISTPSTLPLFRFLLAGRLARLRRFFPRDQSPNRRRQVCVFSRQRVIGRTNGSSVYLLDLVGAIGEKTDVHYISPTPGTLGSWPFLRIQDDLAAFKTIRIRGTWRLGPYIVSANPKRFLQSAFAIADIISLKLGITRKSHFKRAPYSIAEQLTRRDQLYIARHAPKLCDFIVADYCFLTEAFPFALRPEAQTAVVMHDRFSSRPDQFVALGRKDMETILSEDKECDLLGRADAIVAIQWDDADFLRRRLPHRRVIVAPMAAHPVDTPRPGSNDRILFVGSSAAPNVDGLTWFVESCWEKIQEKHPHARLSIAGTVSQFMGPMPKGIDVLGLVPDLKPLYDGAGVVISPLRIGSGLKIKLIEALGYGKAIVGTSKTLQGVEDCLTGTIAIEDDAARFSEAVVALLNDESERIKLAAYGLARLRQFFTPEQCYAELVSVVDGGRTQSESTIETSRVLNRGENTLLSA